MQIRYLVFLLCISFVSIASADRSSMSDDEVTQAIIFESIASYPGTCACPYNRARNGSKCGRRSAYSKPGGYSPICYPRDVSREMISNYRRGR